MIKLLKKLVARWIQKGEEKVFSISFRTQRSESSLSLDEFGSPFLQCQTSVKRRQQCWQFHCFASAEDRSRREQHRLFRSDKHSVVLLVHIVVERRSGCESKPVQWPHFSMMISQFWLDWETLSGDCFQAEHQPWLVLLIDWTGSFGFGGVFRQARKSLLSGHMLATRFTRVTEMTITYLAPIPAKALQAQKLLSSNK